MTAVAFTRVAAEVIVADHLIVLAEGPWAALTGGGDAGEVEEFRGFRPFPRRRAAVSKSDLG